MEEGTPCSRYVQAEANATDETSLDAAREAETQTEEQVRRQAELEAEARAKEETRPNAEKQAKIKAGEQARRQAEVEAEAKAKEEFRLKDLREARAKAKEQSKCQEVAQEFVNELFRGTWCEAPSRADALRGASRELACEGVLDETLHEVAFYADTSQCASQCAQEVVDQVLQPMWREERSRKEHIALGLRATLGASFHLPAASPGVSRRPPRKTTPPRRFSKGAVSSLTCSANSPGRLIKRFPGGKTSLVHAAKLINVAPTSARAAPAVHHDPVPAKVFSSLSSDMEEAPTVANFPRAACLELQNSLLHKTLQLPRQASRERLQEEDVRARLGLPYPFRMTPAGLSGPVMPGASVTSAHLAQSWIDHQREERWLQQALNDITGSVAGDACADRARSLRLETLAAPDALRPWQNTGYMRDRPIRKQESEMRWRQTGFMDAPLRVVTPRLC